MRFGFPRKTLVESGILRGSTDYHSHILPGVDDGVATLPEAIEVLHTFEALGIRELWLTPHIMEDCPTATATLQQRFAELSAAYKGVASKQPLTLHLAAEYMLDSLFVQRLAADDVLPLVDGRHVLVETSYYNPPFGFDDILQQIVARGYTPILAHPERNNYMSTNDYKPLYGKGLVLQLDLFSLVGAYGREAAAKAQWLLKKGYYGMVGSDIHALSPYTEFLAVPLRRSVLRAVAALMQR